MSAYSGPDDQEGMRKTDFRPESNPGLMTGRTFVWWLWLSVWCADLLVIRPGFDSGRKSVFLIPFWSSGPEYADIKT